MSDYPVTELSSTCEMTIKVSKFDNKDFYLELYRVKAERKAKINIGSFAVGKFLSYYREIDEKLSNGTEFKFDLDKNHTVVMREFQDINYLSWNVTVCGGYRRINLSPQEWLIFKSKIHSLKKVFWSTYDVYCGDDKLVFFNLLSLQSFDDSSVHIDMYERGGYVPVDQQHLLNMVITILVENECVDPENAENLALACESVSVEAIHSSLDKVLKELIEEKATDLKVNVKHVAKKMLTSGKKSLRGKNDVQNIPYIKLCELYM